MFKKCIFCLLIFFLLSSFFNSIAIAITYQYDSLHRLTRVERPDGTMTTYDYDDLGNRTSKIVTVPSVTPNALFTASPRTGQQPLFVQFTDQSTGNPSSWAWDFGDGGTSSLQHPSYTYYAAGTYTVSLTVSGAGGSDTENKTNYITVDQTNSPPVADAGPDQTVLEGQMVTLDGSGSADSDDGIHSWEWEEISGPAVLLFNASAMQASFTAPTVSTTIFLTFSLKVTDSYGASDTDRVIIQVNDNGGSSLGIFDDDFNDGVIDTVKWPIVSSNGVYENEGLFKTIRDITDQGGDAATKPIDINNQNPITIERRVKIHYANAYYDGIFSVFIENADDHNFGIAYANYSYEPGDSCAKFGFFIYRNNANPHSEQGQVDVSDRIEPVWDEWFDEKIIYNPSSGILEYFINNEKRMEYNVGPLPLLDQYKIRLQIGNWGWWTGHYQYIDDLKISQKPKINAMPWIPLLLLD